MNYVLDERNNKIEAYSKEEVLSLLAQVIADGSLENVVADAAFINKFKCCVTGGTNSLAFVSQAKYNELAASGGVKSNVLYIITNDDSGDEYIERLNELITAVNGLIDSHNELTVQHNELKAQHNELLSKQPKVIYSNPNGTTSFTEFDFTPYLQSGKGYFIVEVRGDGNDAAPIYTGIMKAALNSKLKTDNGSCIIREDGKLYPLESKVYSISYFEAY